MRRVVSIKPGRQWDATQAADCVLLDAGDRQRRRIVLTAEQGTRFLLDLPHPAMLRDGDGLVLDDGAMIRVLGAPEPLIEIVPQTPLGLVRLAWHLGNRHTDVQLVGDKIRIRQDHVLAQMVVGLGATATPVQAAFDPEAGAPARQAHGHERDHGS